MNKDHRFSTSKVNVYKRSKNYEVLKKQSSYGLIHDFKKAARSSSLATTAACVCTCAHAYANQSGGEKNQSSVPLPLLLFFLPLPPSYFPWAGVVFNDFFFFFLFSVVVGFFFSCVFWAFFFSLNIY